MVITSKGIAKLSFISSAILLAACSASNPQTPSSPYSAAELEERNKQLVEREKAVAKREAQSQQSTMGEELLPPNAKPGECYARVWVEPTYLNYTEKLVTKEAS